MAGLDSGVAVMVELDDDELVLDVLDDDVLDDENDEDVDEVVEASELLVLVAELELEVVEAVLGARIEVTAV